MRLIGTGLMIVVVGSGLVGPAAAQTGKAVPVESDLRRDQQIKERIDDPRLGVSNPGGVQSDPSGVAGTNGPPGVVGGTVNSYAPLPPGAPGSETR